MSEKGRQLDPSRRCFCNAPDQLGSGPLHSGHSCLERRRSLQSSGARDVPPDNPPGAATQPGFRDSSSHAGSGSASGITHWVQLCCGPASDSRRRFASSAI
jgi:hypothetical protein